MGSRPAESGERQHEAVRRIVSAHAPVLALAALVLIWGYSWIAVTVGLRYSQPFTFVALRNSLGAAVLFATLAVMRRPLRPKAFRMTVLVGLLQTTGFFALTIWALETGATGKAVVLTYSMPFWLILMAWALLGERPRGLQWLAVALALAGLILIVRPWRFSDVTSSVLAIGGGFVWAASAVAATILRRRQDVDLLPFTAWQLLIGSLPLALMAALAYDRPPAWSIQLVWSLAFTAVFATAVAWVLWYYVLGSMPVGVAGVSVLAVPVISFALSWLLLSERPAPGEAAGMALIIVALSIITVRGAVSDRRTARLPVEAPPPSE